MFGSRLMVVTAAAAVLTPASALAQDTTPLTQFHIAPNGVVTTKVKFQAGKDYPMHISGERHHQLPIGSTLKTYTEDAFSCYGGAPANTPPNCEDAQKSAVPLTARTAETTTLHPLQEFIPDGELLPGTNDRRHPPFQASHVYDFTYRPKLSGTLVLATSETCSPPARCSGEGYDVQIFPALQDDVDPCAPKSRGHAAAVNEVRAIAVARNVEVHRAGAPEDAWAPLCKGTVLQQGDEISCDPDGAATLQFADNSTVVVKNTTQLKIASFFTEGGVVRTEILLRMGEIAAQVNKSEATKSDFRIKSPTATSSVRGTTFSVFYDPGAKATLTSVIEGLVQVDPVADGLPAMQIPAGNEIEVTDRSASPVSAIGKAGARGGLNRKAALRKVVRVIARANGPCGVRTPRFDAFSIRTAPRGWAVSVKLLGQRAGTSQWVVAGARVKARNKLARALLRRCG